MTAQVLNYAADFAEFYKLNLHEIWELEAIDFFVLAQGAEARRQQAERNRPDGF